MLIGDEHTIEELLFEMKVHLLEWEYVKEHGSSSIIWSDGRELNFIREKLLRLKEELEEKSWTEIPKVPPKMSELFMVNPEAIEKEAKEALQAYEEDENYRYLLMNKNRLPEEYREQSGADGILEQINKLRTALYYHRYTNMKRYLNQKHYKNMLEECKRNVEELLSDLEDLGETAEIKPKEVYHQISIREIVRQR